MKSVVFEPQIRSCRTSDFPAVLSLLAQLWPNRRLARRPLSTAFDRGLRRADHCYICASFGSQLVGFASLSLKHSLWQEGPLGHVEELVVDMGHRGLGIGSLLLRHLEKLAAGRGCRRIELDSALHRGDAHAFYQRRGFEHRALVFSRALTARKRTQ